MENSEHLLALGVIRLDGADTGLVHKIGDVDLITINFGMWVEAVFSEERRGDIRNIKYFKPISILGMSNLPWILCFRGLWIGSLEDLSIEGRW